MRIKKSIPKRILAMIMSILILISIAPAGVVSAFAQSDSYGAVTAVTTGVEIEVEESVATALADSVKIYWLDADPSIGLEKSGWAVGVKIAAPVKMTIESDFKASETEFAKFKEKRYGEDSFSSEKMFWDNQHSDINNAESSERFMMLWAYVNEENLNDAKASGTTVDTYWDFDWNGDDTYEQSVVIKINPENVNLVKDEDVIYPSDKLALVGVSDAAGNAVTADIIGNNSNFVSIKTNKETIFCSDESDLCTANISVAPVEGFTNTKVAYQQLSDSGWINCEYTRGSETDNVILCTTLNVELLKNGEDIESKWRFDWNEDGVYEQMITFVVDDQSVILADTNQKQFYPELGTVIVADNVEDEYVSITGNKTGSTQVEISKLELELRTIKGRETWWTKTIIKTPEHISEEALGDAKFKILNANSSVSVEGSLADGLIVWLEVNPKLLEKNSKIQYTLLVDYNGDSNFFDQTIDYSVNSSADIVLKKKDQSAFYFENTNIEAQWIGNGTFLNDTITGGSEGTGDITYFLSDESKMFADINETTGEVTYFNENFPINEDNVIGEITVNAVKAGGMKYNDIEASYSFLLIKNTISDKLSFTYGPVVEVTYGKDDGESFVNNEFTNQAKSSAVISEGAELKYEIVEQSAIDGSAVSDNVATIDEKTGKVTVLRSGIVKVRASAEETKSFAAGYTEYTLKINKGEQKELSVVYVDDINVLTYSDSNNFDIQVIKEVFGGTTSGKITYMSTNEECATVDPQTGKVKTNKVGTFAITVLMAGNDCYNDVCLTTDTITVIKADQKGFTFEYENPETVYNQEIGNVFVNKAIGGSGDGNIKYCIPEEYKDIAELVGTDGNVQIKKAGIVTVKAVKFGGTNYNDATAVYTLTVKCADQEIKFEHDNVTVYYGTMSYGANPLSSVVKNDAADGLGYGEGNVTYSISENNIGASIDEVTGVVEFTESKIEVGTVTIKATKAADVRYNECYAEYVLTVEYLPLPVDSYEIIGVKGTIKDKETGWYVGDITIKAPEGYLISDDVLSGSWKQAIVINADGIHKEFDVHYRNSDGYITNAVKVEELKRDTVAPTFGKITYKEPSGWDILVGFFGSIFGATGAQVSVSFDISDVTSGIYSLEYSKDGGTTYENITDRINNGKCEFSFEGEEANEANIRYIAIDNAGNKVEYNDGTTIIFNNDPPELEAEYIFGTDVYNSIVENENSTLIYCNNAVTINFNIKEQNFETLMNSGVKPILTVNGEEKTLTWTKTNKENVYTAQITLECAENSFADYKVVCSYDNKIYDKVESITNITIDRENAKITGEFNDDQVKNTVDGHLYYNAAQTFKIAIKDHTFTSENVNFVVTGEGATSELVDYLNEYKKSSKWSKDREGNWVANVTFDVDANYKIEVSYTDMANNEGEKLVKEFTVDTGKPNTPVITYGKSIINRIIEGITFGLFDAPVEVKISSFDSLSGIDRIEYSYVSTDGDYAFDSVDVSASEQTDGEISFVIPVDENSESFQFRGIVSATAYDMSQNASETATTGTDADGNEIGGVIFDTVNPDRVVIPSEAQRVVDKSTFKFIDNFVYSNENQNVILYYNDKATVKFMINEANFVADDVVVKINGTETAIEKWDFDEDNGNFVSEIVISEEGSYVVTLEYEDRSGNKMDDYTSELIIIDKTPVEIDFEYNDDDVILVEDDLRYFDNDQTVAITVDDEILYLEELELNVTAKDFNGNIIEDIDTDAFAEKAASIDNWVKTTDGSWKLSLEFTENAEYSIEVNYVEAAKNESEAKTSFVLDKASPENLNIRYSDSLFSAIVNAVTFGYYKDSAVVTFEATDNISGLDKFVVNATSEGPALATDIELPKDCVIDLETKTVVSGDAGFMTDFRVETVNEKVTLSINVPAQFNGKFTFDAIDRSANKSTYSDGNGVITDTVNPKLEITYTGAFRDMVEADESGKRPSRQSVDTINGNTRFVYGGAVTAVIKISEANFYPDDVKIKVERDKEEIELDEIEWTIDEAAGVHSCEITFDTDGDYQLFVDYSDRSQNAMNYTDSLTTMSGSASYKSNIITVDTTKPVVEITYDNNTCSEGKFFNADRTATITVDDRNFRPNEVKLTVESVDVDGNEIKLDYSKLISWNDWKQNGDVWTAKVPFNKEGNYTVDFTYTDIAQNKVESDYHTEFVVDKTAPSDLEIIYSESILEKVISGLTFGYYKADLTVTIKATDRVSGVKYFNVDMKTNGSSKATDIELPENLVIYADGTISAGKNGFISDVDAEYENGGISSVSFKVPAQFRGEFMFSATDRSENKSNVVDDDNILVIDTITPVFNITYAGDLKDKVEKDGATITRQTVSTVNENTRFLYSSSITATLTIEEANFYSEDVSITVNHDGKNIENFKITEWKKSADLDVYTSVITLEEDGDYVITVEYSDRSTNDMDYSSDEFSDKKGTKTYVSNILSIDTVKPVLKVTYDNNDSVNNSYYNKNRVATFEITDRNFRPNEVVFTINSTDVDGNIISYNYSKLTSWSDWKQNGITWIATVPFNDDGNYVVDLTYTDMAEHKIEKDFHDEFTVDKVAPDELTVEYSENVVEKIIEGLTFGYYKAEATVTLKATDKIAGVEYFTLDSKQNGPDVSTNISLPKELVIGADGKIISGTAGFVSDVVASSEDGVTSVSFKVPAQYRGEFMFNATDRARNTSNFYDDNNVVVVDNIAPGCEVTYTPTNIVSESTMLDVETFDTDDNVVLYYNEDAVVTFKIKEANFYEEDVVIKVNDVIHKVNNWTNSEDEYTGTITLSAEGDYVITVEYTDRSGNEMTTYKSQRIVIDKTAPVITVTYSDDIENTIKDSDGNDRNYYSKKQVATVLVKEHNFRADDVMIKVSAKDVLGNSVMKLDDNKNVVSYVELGKNRSAWSPYETGTWRRTDDGFILEITYEEDANYTFDIDYIDMAKNASTDYEADYFTVDKTAPEHLDVIYGKTTILEEVLESISFGFYNAQMTVSITAEDITSGVHHFIYSYINSDGVSSVNAQLLDQPIPASHITYAGSRATATFAIPKLMLGNDNQFNGTIKFSAFDRAENVTEKADLKRIVVDSIKPVSKVTFNDPVKNTGNISYYAGAINASVVVDEANFFSRDVNITVLKDGSVYPVHVQWVNNSIDIHTGTFTITGDGNYVVSVRYKDKSMNEMTPYQSNQLTIDTGIPKINVSNIKNNSANKAEKYGFTVTATDRNLDPSSFATKLTAVEKNDNGSYSTVNVPLGNVKTVVAGEVYTVTVDNLAKDAVYNLSSFVRDMSANSYSKVILDDGHEYENVKFSINRNGSTFTISDAYTAQVMENYYVKEIDDDIIIDEINVDPIEKYVVTLNGKPLVEGVDFTTSIRSKSDEWFKRSYILKSKLFEEENSYKIVIESIDKTDSKAYSDVKLLDASFVVDKTNPKFVISGVENGGRYSVNAQTVTIIPTDDGGRLQLFTVVVLDSKGNPIRDAAGNDISVRFTKSGAELLKFLEENDGKVTFTIPEGYQQQIKIICSDSSVDINGKYSEFVQVFDKVTVSQSEWVIFYANKPLFYGVIAGSVLLCGGIIFLIFKKKKKDKEE